ncbi:DUF1702 family protein [Paenibacillus elgii]|uniref:DUF1702 family protein n=1 Tax=Paenibacillus elgii TaxID=189691 RepID=UPI0013D2C0FD|nr:DUF1702 family protein [Paenibacillus elgii]
MRVQWLRQNYASIARKVRPLQSVDPFFVDRFQSILTAFLYGYNSVLNSRRLEPEAVRQELDGRFDEFYRGFAYEGLGMGLGARTLFLRSERMRLEQAMNEVAPGYLYQYYVGLGWWLSMRYGFRQAGYRRFLRNLSPLYGPIVFDGVGFRTGLFRFGTNPGIVARFAEFGPFGQRVCYQGLGRCLWFLHEFNLQWVLQDVQRLPPERRGDTISGVGLAVAYSLFDDPLRALELRSSMPAELRPAFRQGLAFGWEARRLQTPGFAAKLEGIASEAADTIHGYVWSVHQVRQELLDGGAGVRFYTDWLDGVRRRLANES